MGMSGGLYMKQRGTMHRLMMVCLFLLLCMQGAAAQELMLPQALLKIEQQAFIGNDAFEYIVLPDGLETIAEKAFASGKYNEYGAVNYNVYDFSWKEAFGSDTWNIIFN